MPVTVSGVVWRLVRVTVRGGLDVFTTWRAKDSAPGAMPTGAMQSRTERFTFSRPPLRVIPLSAGTRSTCSVKLALRAAVLRAHRESRRDAAPETWGVAIEGPLRYAYSPSSTVERTFTPGAPNCTLAGPKLENEARESLLSVAATATMLAAL